MVQRVLNDQDSDAYRHLVETTDKVHTIIGIIVNHQSNARAAMRSRYGVSADDDHFDSRWYEKNPIAQAEHLALNHRQYDPNAVLGLGEAILQDIKDVADRSRDRSVALPDVFETIQRRKDLMKKFLGE